MNSQNALSNMRLAVRGEISCHSTLVLKKIRFYNCAIIYLRNAQLLVKTIDGGLLIFLLNQYVILRKIQSLMLHLTC